MEKPNLKPNNPNFSSGPCAKRPGWKIENLVKANTGRSHRSTEAKSKLKYVIDKSKELLKLPDDYVVGIMPGSDTGALEAALWSLLGKRGVDILAWENFGKDWVQDVVKQLNQLNSDIANNQKDLAEAQRLMQEVEKSKQDFVQITTEEIVSKGETKGWTVAKNYVDSKRGVTRLQLRKKQLN